MKEDNTYRGLDPFFVVSCQNCGSRYWSTRRINKVCSKCGSGKTTTRPPVARKDLENENKEKT